MSNVTFPGVYIRELPSGVRTISGVATSVCAFVGRARRGPVGRPITVTSYADFERRFGGVWTESFLAHSVRDFFRLGGSLAIIVRLVDGTAAPASLGVDTLTMEAENEGEWGNFLSATVDYDTSDPTGTELFNLTVTDTDTGQIEEFRNVSVVRPVPAGSTRSSSNNRRWCA